MKKTGQVYISEKNRRPRRKKKLAIRNVSLVLSLLIVCTVLFILIGRMHDQPGVSSGSPNSFSEEQISADASADASFAPSVAEIDRDEAFTKLKDEVRSFANDFNGRIGISYINLTNNETYTINEQLPFVAASSIKMSIVTKLFEHVASGDLELTDMLKYDDRPYPQGDFEAGSGIVCQEPDGTQFSVGRTAQLAITVSDNCATNMIIRTLGGIDAIAPALNEISAVVPYREQVSYKNYRGAIESGRHRTSALDLSKYAVYLYNAWESDKAAFDPLIENLQNTIFTFGLHTLLPAEVKVAHKIGTNNAYRAENDVGIIFAEEPYVLCIMTETELQEDGRSAISEISLMFYEYIASLYGN